MIVDLDIEKYFDTVNHDKLISILREQVNDATTLHLIIISESGRNGRGLTSQVKKELPKAETCRRYCQTFISISSTMSLKQGTAFRKNMLDDCSNICQKREGVQTE